jgi:heparin binding hemagglutinin HbhA
MIMNEEHTPHSQHPHTDSSQETPSSSGQSQGSVGPDLAAEMREMGQQIEAAVRAFTESERAKQLQRDLSGGVRELTQQLQTAVKSLQTSPRVQQAEARGQQVFSQVLQSKAVQDVQETFVSGLAQFNDQLRKLVERLETDRASQASGTTTHNVPIEHDQSATGETTKLGE